MKIFSTLGSFFLLCGLLQAQDVTVVASGLVFTPADITIQAGQTVQWDNVGGVHNVNGTQATFPDNPESFGNGNAAPAPWTYTYTFTQPGTYDYQCDPHANFDMVGTVTVLPSGNPAEALLISGVIDGPLTGGVPKAIELRALADINDLSRYSVGSANNGQGSDGPEFTFPAIALDSGTCVYVASDSMGFNDFFGFFPNYVSAAATINGDDAIELILDSMDVIDVFGDINMDGSGQPWEYADGWAYRISGTGPDGDVFAENNWTYSGVDALDGATTNDNADPAFPLCSYLTTEPDFLIANDDQVVTDINQPVDIEVLGNDILPNPGNTVVILDVPANGTAMTNPDATINYAPDLDFCGPDSLTYEVCDGQTCDTAQVNITVNCPSNFPAYAIGTVTADGDGDFLADSLGVTCEVTGVVYGLNLRGTNGLQFTIIDGNNDGIGVFSGGGDFGYTVNEGDEITVRGTVDEFNGLTQLSFLDTVILNSSGNTLVMPAVVSGLDESTESQLVRINGLSLVSADSTLSGINYTVSDGTNEYEMRVDADVDDQSPVIVPATGTFDAIGIGGQFDTDTPADDGYQFLPRYAQDIIIVSSTINPALAQSIEFWPNPAQDFIRVESDLPIDRIEVYSLLGQRMAIWNGQEQIHDLQTLVPGTYFLTFVTKEGVYTMKLIKQ